MTFPPRMDGDTVAEDVSDGRTVAPTVVIKLAVAGRIADAETPSESPR